MTTNTTFQFLGADVRILIDERGEPQFVGRDVCEVLGYANPNDAMNNHCRGVAKHYPITDSLGRAQEVRILTEGDVMRLIVSSTLPKAVEFERLVFDEILPSIRKTGKYRIGQKPVQPKRLPAIPDGDYPATIIHCDVEKRPPQTPEGKEQQYFVLTAMIDAGEHAGLAFRTELSMKPGTDQIEQVRSLIGQLAKAMNKTSVPNDTSAFHHASVSMTLRHKWHKSARYNVIIGFKPRRSGMHHETPANLIPLLCYVPPTSEPRTLIEQKGRLLPAPTAQRRQHQTQNHAPVEYINSSQIETVRNTIKAVCKKHGMYSFQVFDWLYNQMDIRDETRIPKLRFKEALSLINSCMLPGGAA